MRTKTERQRLKEDFEETVASGKQLLPEATSARLLTAIHDRIGERAERKTRVIYLRKTWLAWSAAAAVVILLIGKFYPVGRKTETSGASAPLAEVIRTNESGKDSSLLLSDGSSVVLSPGSTIRYYPSFERQRRNIFLTGKALFDVTSDPARPFTVYTGDINTTVLGTRFVVNTLAPERTQVRLLQGKVMVWSSDKRFVFREVYLEPGQQFTLDRQQRQYAVSEYRDNATAAIPKKKISPAGVISATSILEFNQEPLPRVLAIIGQKYGVTFRLDGRGFSNMLVTGKFMPSDPLPSVLSMLGSINRLSFTEADDTIVVARSRP
jgi:ferric-dicitrate binding protein FerR (iron transport regulator)